MIAEVKRGNITLTKPTFETGELLEYIRQGKKMIVICTKDLNKNKFDGTVLLNDGEGPEVGVNLSFPKENFKRLKPTYKIELRNNIIDEEPS